MRTFTITADGTYLLNKHNDANSAIYVSGTMGAATAKLVYGKSGGTFADLADGAIAIGDQTKLEHGTGVKISVSVSGADGSTSIEFVCAGID